MRRIRNDPGDRFPEQRMAETKVEANAAFDFFVEAYGVKYDRAVNQRSA